MEKQGNIRAVFTKIQPGLYDLQLDSPLVFDDNEDAAYPTKASSGLLDFNRRTPVLYLNLARGGMKTIPVTLRETR